MKTDISTISPKENIIIKGASLHNLKNIDVVKNKFLEFKVNEPFDIKLKGNITTGYSWYLTNLPKD